MHPPHLYERLVLNSLASQPELDTPEAMAGPSELPDLDDAAEAHAALGRLQEKGEVQEQDGRWSLVPGLEA